VVPKLKGASAHSTNSFRDQPRQEQQRSHDQRQYGERPTYLNQRPAPQPVQTGAATPPDLSNKVYEERKPNLLSPAEISRKMLSKDRDKEQPSQLKPMPVEDVSTVGVKDFGNGQDDSMPTVGKARSGAADPDPRYVDSLGELHNTLRGRLYDHSGKMVSEVPIRELIQEIQDAPDISAVVFDGIITQRLIELANKRGVREIYGIRSGQISRVFESMLLYTKEQGKL
jgi:DNA primase